MVERGYDHCISVYGCIVTGRDYSQIVSMDYSENHRKNAYRIFTSSDRVTICPVSIALPTLSGITKMAFEGRQCWLAIRESSHFQLFEDFH
jgi:hypothetical protein